MSPTRAKRTRRGLQWPIIAWLTVVWMLLWGQVSLFYVLGGVLASIAVLTAFPLPPIRLSGQVRVRGLAVLVGRFLWDLVRASISVAWLAVRPGPTPMSAVIEVRLRSRSDLYLTLTAELVSLVPGSLLIEVAHDESILYLHIIDVNSDDDVERARERALVQERRVVHALASDAERAEYDENVARGRSGT